MSKYERRTATLERELMKVAQKKSEAYERYKELRRDERYLRWYVMYRKTIAQAVSQALWGE
jgi:hypothetical protein